jgi:hypothetical protein
MILSRLHGSAGRRRPTELPDGPQNADPGSVWIKEEVAVSEFYGLGNSSE